MGTFSITNSFTVSPLDCRVYINGDRRSDVFCTGIVFGMGTEGSTASLQFPAALWDGGKAWLRGRTVRVESGFDGEVKTVFAGYITGSTGAVSDNMITAEALSLIGLANNVYVGQGISGGDMVAEYPARVLHDGDMVTTGWSIKTILRDIFGSNAATWRGGGGSLPSSWRSRIQLGSLTVLGKEWNTFPIGDVVFRQATLADALDQLLGIVGTITFRERFDSLGRTWLEFYELGDPKAPVCDVRVAAAGESALGSNVIDITHDEVADDVRTRMIGLGAPRKFVVSTTSDASEGPLECDWDSSLESGVLANPESTKAGNESGLVGDETRTEYTAAKARVFRQYKLPECLRNLMIDKDLGIELSDGRKLSIHAWKFPRIATYSSGTESWTSTLGTTPKLLEGTSFDLENGTFTLKKPAVNLVSSSVDGSGEVIDVYEEAVVGITLAVQDGRLRHDTDVKSTQLDFTGIADDGLTEVVVNESFALIQITNSGYTIDDITFDAWVFIPDTGWAFYDSAESIQDDTEPLRMFTEAALREKGDVKTTYAITTPFWTPGFRLGDRIRVIGQDDAVIGTHQINSLAYNLTHDHSTTFGTDSAVPLIANEILSGGG